MNCHLDAISTASRVNTNSTEDALRSSFANGDADAFSTVWTKYHPRMLRTAQKILGDHSDAQDAVQDAFLKAFKNADSFRGEAALSTWLTRIVVNCCLMQLRKKRVRVTISLDAIIDDSGSLKEVIEDTRVQTLDDLLAREREEILEKCIENLQPAVRNTVELYRTSEGTIAELAKDRQMSLAMAKSRIQRAKMTLRKTYLSGRPCSRLTS